MEKEGERPSVQDEGIKAAADAIAAVRTEEELPPFVTFSNGLKLRLRPVSQVLIGQVTGRIKDPEPPLVDIGKDRPEPNPHDPDYLAECDRRRLVRAAVAGNTLLVFGTQVEELPPGLLGPEDLAWIEEVKALGSLGVDEVLEQPIDFPAANPQQRYLSWLNYYGLPKSEDIEELGRVLLRLTGISETEVAAAMASFPGREGGAAANGSAAAPAGPDGPNRQQRRAGTGRAPRRARSG